MINDSQVSYKPYLRVALLGLTLATFAATSAAQVSDNSNAVRTETRVTRRDDVSRNDNGSNWGWLGLLGLGGLLGLMPRKKRELHVLNNDPRERPANSQR